MNSLGVFIKHLDLPGHLKNPEFRTSKEASAQKPTKQKNLRRVNLIFVFQKYLSLCTNCNGDS